MTTIHRIKRHTRFLALIGTVLALNSGIGLIFPLKEWLEPGKDFTVLKLGESATTDGPIMDAAYNSQSGEDVNSDRALFTAHLGDLGDQREEKHDLQPILAKLPAPSNTPSNREQPSQEQMANNVPMSDVTIMMLEDAKTIQPHAAEQQQPGQLFQNIENRWFWETCATRQKSQPGQREVKPNVQLPSSQSPSQASCTVFQS